MERGEWEPGTHIADPGKVARAASGIPVVPVFDGYRALAILGVVLLHMLYESGVLVSGGGGGLARLIWGTVGHAVDILFVVSGFVVFLPTVARGGDFGKVIPYAIRRAARLFPAYWLILVIVLILMATINTSPAFPGIGDVTAHLTGLQGVANLLFGGIPPGFGVDPPVWTLSVEVTFYVLMPLFAGIYFRHPLAGLATAAAITLLWTYAFNHTTDVASALGLGVSGSESFRLSLESTLQFPSWAFSFALGMTGAWVYQVAGNLPDSRRRRQIVGAVQLVSLAALAVFAYMAGGYSTEAPTQLVAQAARLQPEIAIGYSASLAVLMVAISLGSEIWRKPFANRRVRQLGDVSYGIYLSHMVLAFYLGSLISMPRSGSAGALLVWILAVVPASVLYGYLSARYVEQPIRRWARRFGRRQTT